MRIERAVAAQAAELTALARRAKGRWGYPAEWLEAWREELSLSADYIDRTHTFTAILDGRVAGTAVVERTETGWSLEHVWIDPDREGRGIGRALVDRALQAAWSDGADQVEVVADPFAEGFYRKLGARPTGARPAPMPGAPTRTLPMLVFIRPAHRT